MTTAAVIMMIVAMLTIWGGLGVAIANLNSRGDAAEADTAEAETHREL